jgi:hypothetical protein
MSNEPLHPEEWDASTYAFQGTEARDIVAAEARSMAPYGMQVWIAGAYVFVCGPVAVVAALDAWVAAQLEAAKEPAPLSGPAWSPSADVD